MSEVIATVLTKSTGWGVDLTRQWAASTWWRVDQTGTQSLTSDKNISSIGDAGPGQTNFGTTNGYSLSFQYACAVSVGYSSADTTHSYGANSTPSTTSDFQVSVTRLDSVVNDLSDNDEVCGSIIGALLESGTLSIPTYGGKVIHADTVQSDINSRRTYFSEQNFCTLITRYDQGTGLNVRFDRNVSSISDLAVGTALISPNNIFADTAMQFATSQGVLPLVTHSMNVNPNNPDTFQIQMNTTRADSTSNDLEDNDYNQVHIAGDLA